MKMAQALSRGMVMVKDGKSFQRSKAGGPQSCGGDRGPKHLPHYSALESRGASRETGTWARRPGPEGWPVSTGPYTPNTVAGGILRIWGVGSAYTSGGLKWQRSWFWSLGTLASKSGQPGEGSRYPLAHYERGFLVLQLAGKTGVSNKLHGWPGTSLLGSGSNCSQSVRSVKSLLPDWDSQEEEGDRARRPGS